MTEFTKDVLEQLKMDERNRESAIGWLRLKLRQACKIIDQQDEDYAKLSKLEISMTDGCGRFREELKAKDEAMMQAQYLLMIYNANRFPIPTRLGDYENPTELITDCRRRLSEALKGKGQ